MYCSFIATDQPGHFVCQRCGFTVGPVPASYSVDQILRACDIVPLHPPAVRRDRGLGDKVARWVRPIARLLGLADCGSCRRRQELLNEWFPTDPVAFSGEPRTLLIRFPHGFGDAVQLTTVLLHLAKIAPDWQIDVASRPGTQSLFTGLSRRQYVIGEEPTDGYAVTRTLNWYEPNALYGDSPSTKAERCLRQIFGLQPIEPLCTYTCHLPDQAREQAARYIAEIGGGPICCIHYQGRTSRTKKDLADRDLLPLIDLLLAEGITPVILDWSGANTLADHRRIHCPTRGHWLWEGRDWADAGTLAALLDAAALNVGIDSGPGHLMGAVETPAIIVWRRQHPLHYFGLCGNVTHLVPAHHEAVTRAKMTDEARTYFARRYDARVYHDRPACLATVAAERLGVADGLHVRDDIATRIEHHQADMIIVRDVYLEDCYGIGGMALRPKYVADVGAHIGTFARLAHRRWPQAKIACIEPHPANWPALHANVGRFADVVTAACTYEAGPLGILSTIYPGTTNTGGSIVTPVGGDRWREESNSTDYLPADGTVEAVTLEAIRDQLGWPRIDLLKLDCEGAEFSILEHADLDALGVRWIVGEWHDRRRFERLADERFAAWRLRILRDGEFGLFCLTR